MKCPPVLTKFVEAPSVLPLTMGRISGARENDFSWQLPYILYFKEKDRPLRPREGFLLTDQGGIGNGAFTSRPGRKGKGDKGWRGGILSFFEEGRCECRKGSEWPEKSGSIFLY